MVVSATHNNTYVDLKSVCVNISNHINGYVFSCTKVDKKKSDFKSRWIMSREFRNDIDSVVLEDCSVYVVEQQLEKWGY